MPLGVLLPVPGSASKWCGIFHTSRTNDTEVSCKHINQIKFLGTIIDQHLPKSGMLQFRKIVEVHNTVLCALAYKNNEDVLLSFHPGATISCQELPSVVAGSVRSWGLVTISEDSVDSAEFKVFVWIEREFGNYDMVLYESRMQAWRVGCKLPAAMVKYAGPLSQFPSVVLGEFVCVFLGLGGDASGSFIRVVEFDIGRSEWAEFDVVAPQAFPRVRLMKVQERLVLVGVQDGSLNVDSYFVMNIALVSTTGSLECVAVSVMPREFCVALANIKSISNSKSVMSGYKDSIFFMSSTGKPVVYSTTRNAWSYVPVFNKMRNRNQGLEGRPPQSQKSLKANLSNG